jgi:predicted permease
MMRGINGWIDGLFRRKRAETRLDAEIRFHLEEQMRDYVAAGMQPEEARRRVRLAFGGAEQIKEECRDARGVRPLEDLFHDLRYAARTLRRSPAFAAVAILSLALGIGANTAIFSLIDAVMLRRLPVSEPARLVQITRSWGTQPGSFSYPLFEHIRDHTQPFAGILAQSDGGRREIAFHGKPETVSTEIVSGSYYSVLGVTPVAGRVFSGGDGAPGSEPVAVIGYAYWKRRFGLDPAAIGAAFTLHGTVFTIVGVTPPEFFGASPGHAPEVILPIRMEAQIRGGPSRLDDPHTNWLSVMARLKPHVTVPEATAAVRVAFENYVREQAGRETNARDKERILRQRIDVQPAGNGFDDLRAEFSAPLAVLMSIVGLVLLIACANLSSLLLARAAARRREISIRLAIGAGPARLLRQFLTESLLLAMLGGGAGILLAQWFAAFLAHMMANGGSLILPIRPDLHVLAFTTGASLLACLLVGLAPAMHAARVSVTPGLKEVRLSRRRRLGSGLIVGQLAISLLLLVCASLFLRTLINLYTMDAGFRRDSLLIFGVNADEAGYKGERLRDLQSRMVEGLNALPGVASASTSMITMISGGGWNGDARVVGYTPRPDEDILTDLNYVGPKYFRTMGTPVLLGREFDARDTAAAGSPAVAIVNKSFARHYFGNKPALGQHVNDAEIVGVVKDMKYVNLREPFPEIVYFAAAQADTGVPWHSYLVRAVAGDAERLLPEIERGVRQIDPALRVTEPRTFAEHIDRSILNERMLALLGGFFGLLALIVASLGIFGVMAYQVERRRNEFGIRMALGATRGNLVWMVLREVARMLLAGVTLGSLAAMGATRLTAGMLFGLHATDPAAFGIAAAMLGGATLAAGFLPAVRAAQVDPMTALRND